MKTIIIGLILITVLNSCNSCNDEKVKSTTTRKDTPHQETTLTDSLENPESATVFTDDSLVAHINTYIYQDPDLCNRVKALPQYDLMEYCFKITGEIKLNAGKWYLYKALEGTEVCYILAVEDTNGAITYFKGKVYCPTICGVNDKTECKFITMAFTPGMIKDCEDFPPRKLSDFGTANTFVQGTQYQDLINKITLEKAVAEALRTKAYFFRVFLEKRGSLDYAIIYMVDKYGKFIQGASIYEKLLNEANKGEEELIH